MKKLLVLMMTLMMILSLAACSGSEATTEADSDITLISKVANYTALLVPSDFEEFVDKDGYAVATGPSSSIVVTPTTESDTNIEDITEDYIVEALGDTYSNLKVLSFDNSANIAGVDAVSCTYTGDSISSGQSNTICQIIMYFSIDGLNCEQQIAFTYKTGANSSLETNLTDIIESISLE